MSSAILPGSYDPVTLGHLAVIREAASKFDEVYVVVFVNPEKKYTFSLDERVKMLMIATDEFENVLVSYSDGLVIDYMRDHGIDKIFKGYRNDVDLEYEKKMAEWNLAHGGYETELWKCPDGIAEVSSTAVRESLKRGDGAEALLPKNVYEYIFKIKENQ